MKAKVVIISKSKKASNVIKEQLKDILGDIIDFYAYSLEDGISGKIACDLCIVPSEDISNPIAEKLFPGTKILAVKRTLNKGEFQKVISLPYGTKALLVNTSMEFALETIATLLEMGANHIDFYPYCPKSENYPKEIKIAITPHELDIVPKEIEKTINIGNRVVNGSTIFDIINILNLVNYDTKNRLFEYMIKILPKNIGFLNLIKYSAKEKQFLHEIVNDLNYVIIACNEQNIIIYQNRIDKNISLESLYGKKIEECFNNTRLCIANDITNEIIKIKSKDYLVNKKNIYKNGKLSGSVIAIRDFIDLEKLVTNHRMSKNASKHKAKYYFEDILGNSKAIKEVKNISMKAAKTDLDILIEGESGTGKEIFANSIHNASQRKNGPFIAFNCAAISSNLLESELFGYDEGAFTGAKKGGKQGLIEAANNGTVFLDEIGEISKDIQVKLLRVLQEREVVRVGSVNRIPINIRVIAATNQNLNELVNQGLFRKDLYYRLNVIPIRIPPLRARKDDIMLFISNILKNRKLKLNLSYEIIKTLEEYDWPGNIRELINYCEYIINMEEEFMIETLPYNIKNSILNKNKKGIYPSELGEKHKKEKYDVLSTIYKHNKSNHKIGRKLLSEELNARNIYLTENEVRTILKELKQMGFVEVFKGRAGTRITDKGIAIINKYN